MYLPITVLPQVHVSGSSSATGNNSLWKRSIDGKNRLAQCLQASASPRSTPTRYRVGRTNLLRQVLAVWIEIGAQTVYSCGRWPSLGAMLCWCGELYTLLRWFPVLISCRWALIAGARMDENGFEAFSLCDVVWNQIHELK